MKQDLIDVWQVILELGLREDFDNILESFTGWPMNYNTRIRIEVAINHLVRTIFPYNYRFETEDESYLLKTVEVDFNPHTGDLDIKPQFIVESEIKSINISIDLK